MHLTGLPLNPKIEVHPLICGSAYRTTVYATLEVIRAIAGHADGEAIFKKLRGAAEVGFFSVPSNMLRSERTLAGDGVFRFGYSNAKLHRLIGFFVDPSTKREFVIIESFEKFNADDYSKAQVKKMQLVAEVYKGGPQRWVIKPLPIT